MEKPVLYLEGGQGVTSMFPHLKGIYDVLFKVQTSWQYKGRAFNIHMYFHFFSYIQNFHLQSSCPNCNKLRPSLKI